jgi:hypothetical protein
LSRIDEGSLSSQIMVSFSVEGAAYPSAEIHLRHHGILVDIKTIRKLLVYETNPLDSTWQKRSFPSEFCRIDRLFWEVLTKTHQSHSLYIV